MVRFLLLPNLSYNEHMLTDRRHLKVMAAFSRRFDQSYRKAAEKVLNDRAIGKPFMVRSQTGDLLDTTGFFVKYATRNGGIFVDCVSPMFP